MESLKLTYVRLHEADGRELYIRADSVIWMRVCPEGTNVGLGADAKTIFATIVTESVGDIIKKIDFALHLDDLEEGNE